MSDRVNSVSENLDTKEKLRRERMMKARTDLFEYTKQLSTNGFFDTQLNTFLTVLTTQIKVDSATFDHHRQTLLVAKYLYKNEGFKHAIADHPVEVNKKTTLRPDLMLRKNKERTIVESETISSVDRLISFPKQKQTILDDLHARLVGKIRYDDICDNFTMAFPLKRYNEEIFNNFNVPLIDYFTTKPEYRKKDDAIQIKRFVDQYYKSPRIRLYTIRNARLKGIFLTDVNTQRVEYRQYD